MTSAESHGTRTVMLCLAGGQPMPNVNAALFLHPQEVHILASEDTRSVAQHTCQALQAEGIPSETSDPVDAFDPSALTATALELVGKLADARLVFHITGGTKMMSIGLYNAAMQASAQGRDVSIVYVDPQKDRLIHLPAQGHWHDEPLQVPTRIATYLLAHGWQIDEKRSSDPLRLPRAWLAAAHSLAASGTTCHELMIQLRRARAHDRREQQFPLHLYLPESSRAACADLLDALQKAGLLQDIAHEADGCTLSVPSTQEWCFLDGNWLEAYVWDVLRTGQDCDEVRAGVCVDNGKGVFQEMDVLATRNGRMLYVSCKTTRRNVTEYVNEMDTVARIAGGLYCAKVFVTNAPSPRTDSLAREFTLHAENRRIVTVFGDQLTDIAARLTKELKQPTYRAT